MTKKRAYLETALFVGLVLVRPSLVDVEVDESFESVELAQHGEEFFSGDDVVQRLLLTFYL